MPERAWPLRALDMLDAIEKIERYTADMDETAFEADERTVDAVVRNLEIIGEAARGLPDDAITAASDVPWRQIRGMRNILAHEYFGVNRSIIWETVERRLPALKAAVERLLSEDRGAR